MISVTLIKTLIIKPRPHKRDLTLQASIENGPSERTTTSTQKRPFERNGMFVERRTNLDENDTVAGNEIEINNKKGSNSSGTGGIGNINISNQNFIINLKYPVLTVTHTHPHH